MIINLIDQYPGILHRSPKEEMTYISTGNIGLVEIPKTISSFRPYLYSGKWIGKEDGAEHEAGDLTIPSNIIELGEHCFDDCGFNHISFEGTIKKLPDYCFHSAYDMTGIDLPNELEEIGEHCFSSTEKLKKLKLPSTVKKIGKNFILDSGIEEIWIPKSLINIPPESFINTGNFKKIHFQEGLEIFGENCFKSVGFNLTEIMDIIIPKSTKIIKSGAFSEIGSENYGIRVFLPVKCEIEELAFNSNIKLFDCTSFPITEEDPWYQNMFIKKDCWGVYNVDKNFYFQNCYFDSNTWELHEYSTDFPITNWGKTAYEKEQQEWI